MAHIACRITSGAMVHWYVFAFVFDVPVFSILFLRFDSFQQDGSASENTISTMLRNVYHFSEPGEIEYQVIRIAR
jgi:hypothetical protein